MSLSPGRIESVFGRARAGTSSPYHWLARSVSSQANVVLDVACGAGAMSRELHRPARTIIGIDVSMDELRLASSRSDGPWVQADALTLPVASDSVDAVTVSMGLAVISSTQSLLAEVARVLRPGGVFAGLLPAAIPASPTDMWLASQLSWHLKTVLRFPGDLHLSFGALCRKVGLTKVEDARERYGYPIRSLADAETLIRALDLRGVSEDSVADALDFLGGRVAVQGTVDLAIPLRRVVAIK